MHDQISFSFVLHWICLEVCHKAIFLIKKQNKENWGSFFEADVLEFIEKFHFRSEKQRMYVLKKDLAKLNQL